MFPPEILDHIFSFLQGDHATLKSCAQVNSVFSNLVEPHLHAQLTFDFASTNRHIFKFSDLLSDRPQIANYVRSLTIKVVDKRYSPHQSVSDIWRKLLRLEVITLTFRTRGTWLGEPRYFRKAFTDCIGLPSLCELTLRGIKEFPLSILGGNKSIRRLVLHETEVCASKYEKSLISECPGLSSLSLYHCPFKSFIIVFWAEMQNLRSISLCMKLQSRTYLIIMMKDLLKVSSKSLTHLEIDFGQECTLCPSYFERKLKLVFSQHKIQPHQRKVNSRRFCSSVSAPFPP